MKKILLFTIISSLILISCKKELALFKPTNQLKKFSQVTTQLYDIDTLSFFKIIGKKGTEIYFNRSDFDIDPFEKITAELKELYSFKELLYNNINTVTNNNELLESSGVIYINFKSNKESVSLKKGRVLPIKFPKEVLKDNNVYLGKVNKNEQFEWTEEEQNHVIYPINKGTSSQPIYLHTIIHKDSVSYYENQNLQKKSDVLSSEFNNSITFFSDFGWINCDRIINEDYLLSFQLESNISELTNFSVYVIYNELNSFWSDYRYYGNLNFKDIKVKNKTYMIILGNNNDQFYSEKIELNKVLLNSKIKLNLQKTTLEKFNRLLEN